MLSNRESVLAVVPETDFSTLEIIRRGKGGVGLLSFLDSTEAYKDILELKLSGYAVTPEGFKALIKCCSNLQSFRYESIAVKTTNLRMIIDTLHFCKNLHTFCLTNTELNAGSVKALADFLKCISLSKLDIDHCHIGEHGVEVLAMGLQSSTVSSLSIIACGIGNIKTAVQS